MIADDIATRIGKEIDRCIGEAFATHGLNLEQVKQLVECGRLVCLSGGSPEELTYRAILDGIDLFCLQTKTAIDMQKHKVITSVELLPISDQPQEKQKE